MRFKVYQLHWIITYRNTPSKKPENFDIDVKVNTVNKKLGVIRCLDYVKQISVAKGLTRYTGLKLSIG